MDGTSADPGADPNPGMLWPVGARLVSATRSMLWLAPLLGGLMLLVHFWRVGYLPALSFSELGVVLGAFGLFVAMGLVAALLLVLFPVWSIRQWMGGGLMPAPPRMTLPIQKGRRLSLSRQPLPTVEEKASPAKRRTFSLKVSPGAFGMFWLTSTVAIALTLGALFLGMRLAESWRSVPILLLVCSGALFDLLMLIWIEFGIPAKALRFMRRGFMQFLLLTALYLVLWPAWFTLLISFDAVPASMVGWALLGMFALMLAPFAHWIWYASMRASGPAVVKVRMVVGVVVLASPGWHLRSSTAPLPPTASA